MRLRSLLFVPGDRPDRMRKALASGADALVLDLEDSVAPAAKSAARSGVATILCEAGGEGPAMFVRINALDSGLIGEDLEVILPAGPSGIVLPKAEGAEDLRVLDRMLSGSEAKILPVATETPRAMFRLGDYGGITERLCGITWGAEDLSAAVGAISARESDGRYRPPYEVARALALFGAHAAAVPAFETIYPDIRDGDGLAAYAERGRRDGFSGMFAVHPAQVPVINAAFRPSDAETAQARRIVELFASSNGAGALSLDGRMVDAPHLAQAQRLLAERDS